MASHFIFLIGMGVRNSGGYSVNMNEVVSLNDHVVVYLNLIKPGENCITVQSNTNPYQFAKIETHHAEVLVKESLLTLKCE
jgi:hypothetical protein